MAWEIVFAAPAAVEPGAAPRPSPIQHKKPDQPSRRPVTLKVQLDPGTTGGTAGTDEDDDD